jgi:hypothetical protein
MTYEQFHGLQLSQICRILNAYDYYLLGESANGGNGNGLDRMGRGWLTYRAINISGSFEGWLRYQNVEDFPAY